MSEAIIEAKGVSKTFFAGWGRVEALRNINFSCAAGDFLTIVGPSGGGKTTLLRLLAGLEVPDAGEILVEGQPVRGPSKNRAIVFQEPRLLPWLTVEKNVAFGLKQGARRTEEVLALVGLKRFAKAYPGELSGGMAQKAAIARALAVEPQVLLMDEPFSALDAQTRSKMQGELCELWQKTGKTILFVTHDIEEAVLLGQQILVLSASPGMVKEIVPVPAVYPRDSGSEELFSIKKEILNLLVLEV